MISHPNSKTWTRTLLALFLIKKNNGAIAILHFVSAVFDKFFTRKITALLLYCTLLALFLIYSLQEK
jgi:hypothetical protein